MIAKMIASILFCALIVRVAGTLEEECNILMKLDSLEKSVQEQEISLREYQINLRDHEISLREQSARISEQDDRISDQAASIAAKDSRLSTLENIVAEKDTHIEELEAILSQQATDMSNLGTNLNATLNEHETELANLAQQLRPVQAVGFTARYPMVSQTSSNHMAFEYVVINEGRAFNASTGLFTCPVAGYYYFNAALLKAYSHDGYASCHITKNGTSLVGTLANPGHIPRTGSYASVNGVYTRLAVNDTVTLGGCRTPIATVFHDHSSFTGFLVTPDD